MLESNSLKDLNKQEQSEIQTLDALLELIYKNRDMTYSGNSVDEMEILNFSLFNGLQDIVERFFNKFIKVEKKILIVGDFDADGATSTALAYLALKGIGIKDVEFLVPNRFEYGYGLTPEIVHFAQDKFKPNVIITVDNGISSVEGVKLASELGIEVLITDHHLPGKTIPDAFAILNPNYQNSFPSKNLAGVGVIFYFIWALHSHLEKLNWFEENELSPQDPFHYLDLVAIGTIADVVILDNNNRILVQKGLNIIRAGNARPGIKALVAVSQRTQTVLTSGDVAFAVAPRLNAAGRLKDMSIGIYCLVSDCSEVAQKLAIELNELNIVRRQIEVNMQEQAIEILENESIEEDINDENLALTVCKLDWHPGVIGIIASRLKDLYKKPTTVFTESSPGILKGSLRSINSVHIRDVLANINTKYPELIKSFGGHAMAAGVSIKTEDLEEYQSHFNHEVSLLSAIQHRQPSEKKVDAILGSDILNLRTAESLLIKNGPWGQGFIEPLFAGIFNIVSQRLVGDLHIKFMLSIVNEPVLLHGILFFADKDVWPNYDCQKVAIKYRLSINEYRNIRNCQLVIEDIHPIEDDFS
jgi:single-stranded-DNA-specific exonuclease